MTEPQRLLHRTLPTVRQGWSTCDSIPYALVVGTRHGADAWDDTGLGLTASHGRSQGRGSA
jgi:hypothetical protein